MALALSLALTLALTLTLPLTLTLSLALALTLPLTLALPLALTLALPLALTLPLALSLTLALPLALALTLALALPLTLPLTFALALAFTLAFALTLALAFTLAFALTLALAFTLAFALTLAVARLVSRWPGRLFARLGGLLLTGLTGLLLAGLGGLLLARLTGLLLAGLTGLLLTGLTGRLLARLGGLLLAGLRRLLLGRLGGLLLAGLTGLLLGRLGGLLLSRLTRLLFGGRLLVCQFSLRLLRRLFELLCQLIGLVREFAALLLIELIGLLGFLGHLVELFGNILDQLFEAPRRIVSGVRHVMRLFPGRLFDHGRILEPLLEPLEEIRRVGDVVDLLRIKLRDLSLAVLLGHLDGHVILGRAGPVASAGLVVPRLGAIRHPVTRLRPDVAHRQHQALPGSGLLRPDREVLRGGHASQDVGQLHGGQPEVILRLDLQREHVVGGQLDVPARLDKPDDRGLVLAGDDRVLDRLRISEAVRVLV